MAESSEEEKAVLQSTSSDKAQQSCLLAELTPSNCGIGVWILRVVQPRVIEYMYCWQGQQRQGKKAEYILLSEDSNAYCMGVVKCSGTSVSAEQNFKANVQKFQIGTIWSMSRITLASEKNRVRRITREGCHRFDKNEAFSRAREPSFSKNTYAARELGNDSAAYASAED